MSRAKIADQLCAEVLQYLNSETAFLQRVEDCAARIAAHPVGKAFPNELVEELVGIQRTVGGQNVRRATLQTLLATELEETPSAIRLSGISADSDTTRTLQTRRKEVLRKALSLEAGLRNVLGQLTESNVIVTAVLESVLNAPVDSSRYDSDGKPVQQVSHIEGQRVA